MGLVPLGVDLGFGKRGGGGCTVAAAVNLPSILHTSHSLTRLPSPLPSRRTAPNAIVDIRERERKWQALGATRRNPKGREVGHSRYVNGSRDRERYDPAGGTPVLSARLINTLQLCERGVGVGCVCVCVSLWLLIGGLGFNNGALIRDQEGALRSLV